MPWKSQKTNAFSNNRLVAGPPLDYTFSLLEFRKGGMAQRLLHEIKYNKHQEIALRLGRMLGLKLAEKGYKNSFDLILPVPLHRSRHRNRGFNQSTVFAKGMSEIIGGEVDEKIAERKFFTATQTKKDKVARWNNVKDAFFIIEPERIAGKKVLLADDVVTTGATIVAFGQKVYHHSPLGISIASIADVPD